MTIEQMRQALAALMSERSEINAAAEERLADPENTTEVRGAFLMTQDEDGNSVELLDAEGHRQRDPLAGFTEEEAARWQAIDAEAEALRSRIDRAQNILDAPTVPNVNQRSINSDVHEIRRDAQPEEVRGQALTAIEDLRVPPTVREELTRRVEERFDDGMNRHIINASSDAYRGAFQAFLSDTPMTEEQRAAVNRVETESRATLAISTSGFILPVTTDPTFIMPGGLPEMNPLDRIATVETIGTASGVVHTMGEMEASWDMELEEVSEDEPTIGGVEIKAVKPQIFGAYSIEAEQDLPRLEAELVRAMGRAKNKLESSGFVTGTGIDPFPQGLLQGLIDLGKTPAATTVDQAGLFAVRAALGQGYRDAAQWLGAQETYDTLRSLESVNGAPLWGYGSSLVGDNPDMLLGRTPNQSSGVPAGVLIYGDFASGFRIIRRLGMTVERIPHIFGPNNRPMGKRGLYGYWRVGSAVVDPDAFAFIQAA